MARIEKTVFISYRRKDVSWALAVYQDLTHQGYDVFFDYTNIPSGDFEQNILSNIKARAHFVLILTPTALDRCSESGDWLRREIELAIDERRNIIPLFFDGFYFGNVSEKLTGKLKKLSSYNGMNVHQDYFLEAMERLRNKFLNVLLNAVLHPVSAEVQEVVLEEQRAANNAADEAKVIEKKKKQKEFIDRISKLISSNIRRFSIGGIVLLVLIFGGFGLNYLVKSLPVSIATISSPIETPIPTPTLGIGSTRVSEKDGMILVYVPDGESTMGSNDGLLDEMPVHQLYLDAFWIDHTEVTNKQYSVCVAAGMCEAPVQTESLTRSNYFGDVKFNNYPVISVDWKRAKNYCEWVNRRLPTEAEWEKAARGTNGYMYPWGAKLPNSNLLNYNDEVGDTVEVGKYPDGASVYGAFDMAGNVLEWVSSLYQPYPYTIYNGRENMDSLDARVLRGGSLNLGDYHVRSTYRIKTNPAISSEVIGFRCAISP